MVVSLVNVMAWGLYLIGLIYLDWLGNLSEYTGSVRAESFTRPKQIYQNGIINNVQESRQETYGPECTSDPTFGEALQDTEEPLNSDDDEIDEDELLDRLATRHFYRYLCYSVAVFFFHL